MTADGRVIPGSARTQIEGIEDLDDWSAVVTPAGEQLMTASGWVSPTQRASSMVGSGMACATLLMALEKLPQVGDRLGRPLGAALLGAAAVTLYF